MLLYSGTPIITKDMSYNNTTMSVQVIIVKLSQPLVKVTRLFNNQKSIRIILTNSHIVGDAIQKLLQSLLSQLPHIKEQLRSSHTALYHLDVPGKSTAIFAHIVKR